jgi:hypothetical protein
MSYASFVQARTGWRRAVLSGGVLAALAAALAAGAGIALTSPDALISRGFANALEGTPDSGGDERGRPAVAPVAGSEEFWLTRKAHGGEVEPAAWAVSPTPFGVAAGDRITIRSGGKDRVLEVVAVTDAPGEVTRIDTDTVPRRQIVVTCRDTSDPHGALIRFIAEAASGSGAKPVRSL